jgi:clan AA aspartic protease
MKRQTDPIYGADLGLTYITTRIEGLDRTGFSFEGEFLVDTGAIDCIVPSSALVAAGVCEEGRASYQLANGEVVEYPYGFARITFMGVETIAQVVFGPEDNEPLLGVVALESAGFGVDPITKTLKRMATRPLKRAA